MNIDKKRLALYSAGLIICMATWFLIRVSELSTFHILNFSILIIFSYAAMVFDIKTKRIPNLLVLIMMLGWLLIIVPTLFINTEHGIRLLADSIFGLLLAGGLFLLVYFVSRKGLGGGDVKFMAAVGLYLGFAEVLPTILYGTILAAITGLILILLKKIDRKGKMPLVPFLFVGIMITLLVA
ncbi:MAG: A24 family peptidase [Oscillospiraceae bacterium]|nr:A24 family peptidase [Oscillospiraceae bacterium]